MAVHDHMRGPTEDMPVFVEEGASQSAIDALAAHAGLHIVQGALVPDSDDVHLRLDASGLALEGAGQCLRGDFSSMLPRMVPGKLQRELVVRAAKVKGVDAPRAIDATAGLGEDAFLLAAAGFSVQMYELDPVIAVLLADALRRARADARLAPVIERMSLAEGDSIEALRQLASAPDVVLLDPMFPARRKSALVKKKFQLLHQLERPCADEEALLQAAIDACPRKVVIKRPLKGAALAGRKPSYSLKGTSIRYDCIVVPSYGAIR